MTAIRLLIARSWLIALVAGLLGAVALVAAGGAAHAAVRQPRVAFILLDTNNSPPKTRLATEQQAAIAYAGALPRDVKVGLIAFSQGWRTVLLPTAHRDLLDRQIDGLKYSGPTSDGLGPAIAGAVSAISKAGAHGRLLVLSDGELLTQPIAPVAIPVDVVSSVSDHQDDHLARVRRIAVDSHGRYVGPDNVAELARAVFPPLKSVLSPSAQAGRAPAPAVTMSLVVVLSIVFVILLFFATLALRSLRRGTRPHLAGQIAQYGPKQASVPVQQREGKLAGAAVGAMSQLLRSRNVEPRLAQRLDSAGITRPPAEWALLGTCISVALAGALTLLSGNFVLGLLVGVVAGWAGMRLYLSFRISRRHAAFEEQLPNVLQLVASSVQSGFSLAQALDAVVREDAQPASGEFARALAETRIGIDLADALDQVASRLDSDDLRWVVMAIRIQRETGGNLSEVLRNTVSTMRERSYLRRQVRTLSAEGKLSAYILIALPILVAGWLFLSDPSYMRPLYLTLLGLVMLLGSVTLVIIGAFWMRKLIKVEV